MTSSSAPSSDAAAGQHQPVAFHVWPTLTTLWSSSIGLSASSACLLGDLPVAELGREQAGGLAFARLAMAERQIGRPRSAPPRARCRTARSASDRGWWFRSSSAKMPVSCARCDPLFELGERCDGFVFGCDRTCWRARPRSGVPPRRSGSWPGRGRPPALLAVSGAQQRQLALPAGAAWRRRRRRRRGGAPARAAVGVDRGGVDADFVGDALRQRLEAHRLEEGDQVLVVRLVHGELVDRRPPAARSGRA